MIGDARALRRFYEAFNDEDLAGLLATTHPDVMFLPLLGPLYEQHVYRGHAGMSAWFGEIQRGWDRFEAHVEDLHEIADITVAFVRLVGHRGGRALEARIAVECRFRGGRIHRMRGRDLHETAEQLGVLLAA